MRTLRVEELVNNLDVISIDWYDDVDEMEKMR